MLRIVVLLLFAAVCAYAEKPLATNTDPAGNACTPKDAMLLYQVAGSPVIQTCTPSSGTSCPCVWTRASGAVTSGTLVPILVPGADNSITPTQNGLTVELPWAKAALESVALTVTGNWNMSGGVWAPPTNTYAAVTALTPSSYTNRVFMVSDGSSSACSAGGGTTRCWLVSTGSAWVALAGSGSGASSFVENFAVGGYRNGASSYTGTGWYVPVTPNGVTESLCGDYSTAGKHVFPCFVYADDATNDRWAVMQTTVAPGITRLDVDVWTYESNGGTGNMSWKADAACVSSPVDTSSLTPSWIGTAITVSLAGSNTVGTTTKNAFANVDVTGCVDGNILLVRVRRAAADAYPSDVNVIHARLKQIP